MGSATRLYVALGGLLLAFTSAIPALGQSAPAVTLEPEREREWEREWE